MFRQKTFVRIKKTARRANIIVASKSTSFNGSLAKSAREWPQNWQTLNILKASKMMHPYVLFRWLLNCFCVNFNIWWLLGAPRVARGRMAPRRRVSSYLAN